MGGSESGSRRSTDVFRVPWVAFDPGSHANAKPRSLLFLGWQTAMLAMYMFSKGRHVQFWFSKRSSFGLRSGEAAAFWWQTAAIFFGRKVHAFLDQALEAT